MTLKMDKHLKKIDEIKSCFWEKIYEIGKFLARLKKREGKDLLLPISRIKQGNLLTLKEL